MSWNRAGFSFNIYCFFSSKLFFLGQKLVILRKVSITIKKTKKRVKMQRKVKKKKCLFSSWFFFELNKKGREPSRKSFSSSRLCSNSSLTVRYDQIWGVSRISLKVVLDMNLSYLWKFCCMQFDIKTQNLKIAQP